METKKAYGIVTALGTKLGERARDEPDLLDRIRATASRAELEALLREKTAGLVPDALVSSFCGEVLHDAEWLAWRSRILLQAKLTRDGGKPAPGHEAGRGVRKG